MTLERRAECEVRDRSVPARFRRPLSAQTDEGMSVIEIVMTITIMAIVMVPVMSAVVATIRASSSNTQSAQLQTVLQNASDRVNRAPKSCDYTQFAQAAVQTEGWSASQVTVVQTHYVPGTSATVSGRWDPGSCIGPAATDLLVQKVEITVTSPSGAFRKTVQVVKSDV